MFYNAIPRPMTPPEDDACMDLWYTQMASYFNTSMEMIILTLPDAAGLPNAGFNDVVHVCYSGKVKDSAVRESIERLTLRIQKAAPIVEVGAWQVTRLGKIYPDNVFLPCLARCAGAGTITRVEAAKLVKAVDVDRLKRLLNCPCRRAPSRKSERFEHLISKQLKED